MPRRWTEKVNDFPRLRPQASYRVRVEAIEKVRSPASVRVTIVHVQGVQAGRQHVVTLPLPVRPAGFTADYFRACGQLAGADQHVGQSHF